MCVPACSRMRWTSSVTSTAPPSSRGPRDMPGRTAMRSAAAAARPPEAAPRFRGGSQPPLSSIGEKIAVRSPPACDHRLCRGESLRTPCSCSLSYPARPVQAALCRAAPCGRGGGGRGAQGRARPVYLLPASRPAYLTAPARQKGRRWRPRLRQGCTIRGGSTPLVCDSVQCVVREWQPSSAISCSSTQTHCSTFSLYTGIPIFVREDGEGCLSPVPG